ncbi:MAG: hypothetical protein ABIQ90_15650 [Polaromonas sp.]
MIYAKTQSGQSVLQNRSVALTFRQRTALIMFDGKHSSTEVLKATAGMGITQNDVDHLVAQGMLALVAGAPPSPAAVQADPAVAVPAPVPAAPEAPSENAQAHYLKAYPIATRLTAGLGLRGFMLNLAVEAASDLDKLQALAPKIMKAVGPEKFRDLNSALYD